MNDTCPHCIGMQLRAALRRISAAAHYWLDRYPDGPESHEQFRRLAHIADTMRVKYAADRMGEPCPTHALIVETRRTTLLQTETIAITAAPSVSRVSTNRD